MRQDLFDVPAAAQVMPDHHVKGVAAVGAVCWSGTDDPLDLIDAVAAAIAVEGIAVDRCRGRSSCLAALAPGHAPVEHLVDAGELMDCIKPIAVIVRTLRVRRNSST